MFVLVCLLSLGVGVTPSPTSDYQHMQCGYHGYCHTEAKGVITKSSLRLPDIEIPPEVAEFKFIIPDRCAEWGRDLAGCVVHVCDSDATPTLTVSENAIGVAKVLRPGMLANPAYVYMNQYCI
ncbi:uncharacterized protein LOC133518361 [Cydia pomonella]|uniref:uncharacterized protein LOC133518361 n=1 Tax=Cydia pomonella TaxID=82600 RepID=UPI002ADDCA1A|nr:uncharacterized protein LOC133518361 [Cydia pomonella]